ncbi:putative bifunctional diguanylate cyclase/phosphodiesterase [Sphingomonas montana]|uniref:putative bifunctional diguanylate cyclase/phosphodiesterase n=1 Tax=Sphingomonas montana TaxID=1843236 RepID=UPI00096F289F|nr:EAL domain-containing protein [Sphingomonas montana]
MESALHAIEERYRYTVALSPLIPWVADAHGAMIDIDARGLEYTGLTHAACMGSGFLATIHPSDRAVVKTAWNSTHGTVSPLDYEIRLQGRDGTYRWHRTRAAPRLEHGKVVLWYGTIEDVHDRRMADEAVRWSADHDDLTGLWNRRAFMAGLGTALAATEDSGTQVALLLIDLDGLKSMNDRYGHDLGDALLKETARRLARNGAGDSMAGRLGGDEFALFVHILDVSHLEEILAALQHALALPWVFSGQAYTSRASIGVAIYPLHGDDADDLYKNADLALYEAKAAGGGGVRFFEGRMRASLQTRFSELSVARYALDHDQILPFYQPKIDLCSGQIFGFEALLRWRDTGGEIQAPGMIAAAFADAQLAIALDERMFERITADIAIWRKLGLPFGRIAFNVSGATFRQQDFKARILSCIARAGVLASDLELEVTENVLLERTFHDVTATFEHLRALGMTIALDDFGTGYASLVHLKKFPVDTLKIDWSFVQALADPCNVGIVRAIVNLGKDLGITTVAEGIETKAQADRLHHEGCDQAQGYLFSRAVAAEEVPLLLARPDVSWRRGERRPNEDRYSARMIR